MAFKYEICAIYACQEHVLLGDPQTDKPVTGMLQGQARFGN